MPGLHEVELRIALAEGLLSPEHVEPFAEEARRRQQSPLALLVERGRLSPDTFASLQAEALHGVSRLDERRLVRADGSPLDDRASIPAFPVPAWDRYASLRFLGQGGMGKVFLARDLRLHREVAIKFVHGDHPARVRRLIAEARAQARVSHERVCKVHEVGEVDGRVYIAMQYIDGKPLGALAGELTIEQKLRLVRGAAAGIHDAHRAGIIHRDIKPSNILVERDDDGALRPYVVDFGLARSVQEDDATLSGVAVGTPYYMAPEQARDDGRPLDRRADVYSLGATLYHLLTGQPPISGTTVHEVLHRVVTAEPRLPRAIKPEIPVDVESIVVKCLEKDRSARYESAEALADDLGRFLRGEPVVARGAGAWYRTRKRVARHKRAVGVSAMALGISMIAVLIAVGWGVRARREAGERERFARRFTERVEHIEAIARYSALSPRHDIRADRAAMRGEMAALEREIGGAGAAAAGPGQYALGRGYLALEDPASAREHLEIAWQRGFREPRTAYALALAIGRLYQQHLLAAERIGDEDLRAARKLSAEQQYRDPALAYLAAARGAEVPSTEYIAALTAYYGGQLDDALGHVDGIAGGLPWFYESAQLRGDILLARALKLRDRGDDRGARVDFEAGRQAYIAAGAIADSAATVFESLSELEYAVMVMELYGGGNVRSAFDRTVAATARALAILPDHEPVLVLEARAQRSLAEYEAAQGRDPEDVLAHAISVAQRAIAVSSGRPQARLELSRIYRQWGEVRAGRHRDPSEPLQRAVDIAGEIDPDNRDAAYYGDLGLIYQIWADHEDAAGRDARVHRRQAIAAYDRAIQIDDRMADVWINLAINYFVRASQSSAEDPDGDLTLALRALEAPAATKRTNVAVSFYQGEIHKAMGERARSRGGDPRAELALALDAYRRGLGINPRLPHLHNGIGIVHLDEAMEAWNRGDDPAPSLERARAAFADAIAAAPEQGFGYGNLGDALCVRASFERAGDKDPRASVLAAVAALNQAIERVPEDPRFWANLGTAHAILAAYEIDHGRDPRATLRAASSALRKALDRNPRDAPAQRTWGETLALSARLRGGRDPGTSTTLDAAAHAFQQAIDLAPGIPKYPLALAEFYRTWATLQPSSIDTDARLARGIALLDPLLARRPSWPDGRVVRAGLRLAQAQRAADIDERRALAARAREEFASALTANPALEKVWRRQAEQARILFATPRSGP